MADLLSTGTSGVLVYQRALAAVSNNIANVATDGYVRQEEILVAQPSTQIANNFLGNGVTSAGVRRAYNEFLEQNLRNSNSLVFTQSQLVEYANQVVDVMASSSSGLSGLIDGFFGAARDLSSDPSSVIYRSAFIRNSQSLATGFRQTSSTLAQIDEQAKRDQSDVVTKVNNMAGQIAYVNSQLSKKPELNSQPPELLDQRDRLLRDLSELVGFSADFETNGEVNISLAYNQGQGVLVSGQNSRALSIEFRPQGTTNFVLDSYGDAETVGSVTGGRLGAALVFREQILQPTARGLDSLAAAFANEINAIQRNGTDLLGERGGDLFGVDGEGDGAAANMAVLFSDPQRVAAASLFRVTVDATNLGDASATVSSVGETPSYPLALTDVLAVSGDSVSVNIGGGLQSVFKIPAGSVDTVIYLDGEQDQWPQLVTSDGRNILGQSIDNADQLLSAAGIVGGATVSNSYLNAYLGDNPQYRGEGYFLGVRALALQSPIYEKQWSEVDKRNVGVLVGYEDVAATILTDHTSLSWDFPIADGAIVLNGVSMPALDTADNGFQGANEIADWINSKTEDTGVVATAQNEVRLPLASLFSRNTGTLSINDRAAFNAGDLVAKPSLDDLVAAINGIDWGELEPSSRVVASVSGKELILANGDGSSISVGGTLLSGAGDYGGQLKLNRVNPTEVRLTVESFSVPGEGLSLIVNGQTISATGDVGTRPDLDALVAAVNLIDWGDTPLNSRVVASASGGKLLLKNNDGTPINVYGDMLLPVGRYYAEPASGPIEIGLDPQLGGSPAVMKALGMRTGVYIDGPTHDDLIYMVSGSGIATVSASSTPPTVMREDILRRDTFEFTFVDPDDDGIGYISIKDTETQTELARRVYHGSGSIDFAGLRVTFSDTLVDGDKFHVDGNHDGIGDNSNINKVVNLETEPVLPGGLTLSEGYFEQVTRVGGLATQAKISADALEVVRGQAEQSRDAVSGVSIDQEAADLIRFQQAYQANARVIQAANDLFDSIKSRR